MHDLPASPLLLCVLVVVVGATSSLFPVSPVEPWLIGVAIVAPGWLIVPLIVLVTVSSMAAKTVVFLGGRRVEAAFRGKTRQRFDRLRDEVAGRPRLQRGTLFVSSLVGFPPFYLITALCGTLRMPLRHFVVLATTGRAIRFATLMTVPHLFITAR
jgi:membrane protein YqaA with SNARE-associated domain